MEEQAGRVMSVWIEAEKADVEKVRQPRYGMPVRGLERRHCPLSSEAIQALLHMFIADDINAVIDIDELKSDDWREDGQRHAREQNRCQ